MFSIGEFAQLGSLSVRTLRHYGELGLLRPAWVDPQTGYRRYSMEQVGRLNRILALRELGLPLQQIGRLLDGVTVEELRGMLLLRRAELERELDAHRTQLLRVEAHLSHIDREGTMPADDIVAKTFPAMGVVVIGRSIPGWGPANVLPAYNAIEAQFGELGIPSMVEVAGPSLAFYEGDAEDGSLVVNRALPVRRQPDALPPPAAYRVLPAIEAAVAVRSGPAASIFPYVYQDLARWISEHGYQQTGGPAGREVLLQEVATAADAGKQVIEVQLPFVREDPAQAGP